MSASRPELHISRRTLLKVIAAAGGSLAASTMLPGKWVKPAMRVGVLPVHAQTSIPTPTPTPTAAPQQTYQIVSSTALQDNAGDGCYLNLSVTISPADSGIEMQVVINDTVDARTETITSTTDQGVATFDASMCTGSRFSTVTFSFVDATQCTTNCSVEYTFPGP